MLTLSFEWFEWDRPAGRKKGFAWEGEGEVLRMVQVPGVRFEKYQPPTGLYRELAALPEEPEAILRFANRYGSLGSSLRQLPDAPEFSEDRLTEWLDAVRWFRERVSLADAVAEGDLAAIREALAPLAGRASFELECDEVMHERVFGKISDPNRLSPDGVAQAVAAVLYQPISEAMDWCPAASWNAKTKAVEVRLKPWGIWEFMYVQLCDSLVSGRHYQQCKACGKWFQLAPGVGRADKTTCSPSCRFTRYRQRRRRALELHSKGWSAKKIAKELGSEVGKVEEWLSKGKD